MISMIWAEDLDHVIGDSGSMPWHYREDMQHFYECTIDNTVVMGYRTWESLPDKCRPLPGRTNVVLTRSVNHQKKVIARGGHTCSSVLEVLRLHPQCIVIGGRTVFDAFMPYTNTIYLTKINSHHRGDTYAPKLNLISSKWKVEETRRAIAKDATMLVFYEINRNTESSAHVFR